MTFVRGIIFLCHQLIKPGLKKPESASTQIFKMTGIEMASNTNAPAVMAGAPTNATIN